MPVASGDPPGQDDAPRLALGAVLAGGRGSRLGGAKAVAELAGRPLAAHAVAALREVCATVVVVARPGTALPRLDVPVWHDEPAAGDLHPLHGIVRALRGARELGLDRALVLAVDLPLVTREALTVLLEAGPTAVARAEGRLQPLCAVYASGVLDALHAAPPGEALTATVARLDPVVVDVPPGALLNVNRPADLGLAPTRLGRGGACDDSRPS